MITRAERRNKSDNKKIEYEVFGRFKSHELSAGADAGDDDHRCLPPKPSRPTLFKPLTLTQCVLLSAARIFPPTAHRQCRRCRHRYPSSSPPLLTISLPAPFRRWMKLPDIFAALNDRALIDAKVKDFFGDAPAAHNAAMDLLVPSSD